MEFILSRFLANINNRIYLKDPESSQLGRNIIRSSIQMIANLGFEDFTIKKLSLEINSTEASIYRYFDNKQKILLYLSSLYWGWVEYKLVLKNANISDPKVRLNNSILVLTTKSLQDETIGEHIDLDCLFTIICGESSKSYFTKTVDSLNKDGVYTNFKKLVGIISDIITEVDPQYPYPHMLTTTIIEGIHHQVFFKDHLKSLTDLTDAQDTIFAFYSSLVFCQLNKDQSC